MKDKAWATFEKCIRSVDSIEEAEEEMTKANGIITFQLVW